MTETPTLSIVTLGRYQVEPDSPAPQLAKDLAVLYPLEGTRRRLHQEVSSGEPGPLYPARVSLPAFIHIRRWWCVPFLLALGACGGGSTGSTGNSSGTPVQIAYADLNADLFTSIVEVPSIAGLTGRSLKCDMASGSLPPGVTLAPDCSFGGAPTQLGTFHATVTASVDGVAGAASATATVTITAPSLHKLRDASGGAADQQLRLLAPVTALPVVALAQGPGLYVPQTGDTLVYSLAAGALPSGLSLDPAAGTLSGTPSVYGAATASIALTINHAGQTFTTAPVLVSFSVVEGPFTLSYFDCCVSAVVGDTVNMTPLSTYLPVPGATSRFSIDSSSAPQGPVLDPVNGSYSGMLTSAGSALSVTITQTVTYPDGTTSSARWSSQSWTVLANAPPQLQYMQQVGSLGTGAMSISITPTQFNGTTPPQISGSIDMAGFLGSQGFNIGAPVATITSSHLVDSSGKPYISVVLTTRPFGFIDLATGVRTTATMRTVSNNISGTRGHIAFTVTSVATGAILASSGMVGGQPTSLALSSGNTTMKGF
jgi:hypothetical protein